MSCLTGELFRQQNRIYKISRIFSFMKITKEQLRKIINEEIKAFSENEDESLNGETNFFQLMEDVFRFIEQSETVTDAEFDREKREISLYLYDPNAPDSKSQPFVSIRFDAFTSGYPEGERI